jgi:hypothetical protein
VRTEDYNCHKYKQLLIDNCKKEWILYCNSIDAIKSEVNIGAPTLNEWLYFWLEYGAFTKTLPRQIGKTTFLMEEARLKNGIVITATHSMMRALKQKFNYSKIMSISDLHGRDTYKEWLFIDEYDILSKDNFNILLNRPWQGVMMLSTCCKGMS